jgi:hypothetical protein
MHPSKSSVADYGIVGSPDRWTVDLTRRGKRHRKAFLFSTHGGARAALKAARAWRDAFVAANPPQYTRDIAQRPRSDSKGIPGVFCCLKPDGRPHMWIAKTQVEPGRVLSKGFSVGRYGKMARKMAIAERARQLEAMRLRVLSGRLDAQGVAFLQRHGGEPAPIALESEPAPPPPLIPPDMANRREKIGFSGVECRKDHQGKPQSWVARTRAGGREQRKVFAIAVYGAEQAKELAIAERRRQLERALLTG